MLKRDSSLRQINILKIIKKITKRRLILDHEASLKDYYFFTSWADSYGGWNLKRIIEKKDNLINNLKSTIKYIIFYSIANIEKYKLSGTIKKNKKKNLIISYTNNFKISKKYDDYFSCKIKDSNKTHWFLINFDNFKKIKKLPKNLSIFSKNKNFFYLNLKFYYNLIKYFFIILLDKKNLINFQFNKFLRREIVKILAESDFSKVFIPYESQPHQHYLIKIIKKFNKKIKIIGYLHSSLTPLPTDFIYKNSYEPDMLIVHGASQKEILIRYLGWNSKKIKIINSFRYRKKPKDFFTKKIFLPFSLKRASQLLFNLRKFLEMYNLDIKKFKIINHPYMSNSRQHIEFMKKSKSFKNFQKNFQFRRKDISIVIGVSAIILEMLENKLEVIHICSEPIYEKHSEDIWKNIVVKKLEEGIYSYKLKKIKTLINFGKKNDFEKKFNIY